MVSPNIASSSPDPTAKHYYSAYRGTVNDAEGNFDHFLRIVDAPHREMGYWRFKAVEDDRRAFARGLLSPEEVLMQQDRTNENYGDITIRWIIGSNDPNMKFPLSGTAAEHLHTIYELRQLLGKPMSLRGQIPAYPISNDDRVKEYWEKKRNAQIPPLVDHTLQIPERPIPSPITSIQLQSDVKPLPVSKTLEGRITRARSAKKAQKPPPKQTVATASSRGQRKAPNAPSAQHPTAFSSTNLVVPPSHTTDVTSCQKNTAKNVPSTAPRTAHTSLPQLPPSQAPPASTSASSQQNRHQTFQHAPGLNSFLSQQQSPLEIQHIPDSNNYIPGRQATSSSRQRPPALTRAATVSEPSFNPYKATDISSRPSTGRREVGIDPTKQNTQVANEQDRRALSDNPYGPSTAPSSPSRPNNTSLAGTLRSANATSSGRPASGASAPFSPAAVPIELMAQRGDDRRDSASGSIHASPSNKTTFNAGTTNSHPPSGLSDPIAAPISSPARCCDDEPFITPLDAHPARYETTTPAKIQKQDGLSNKLSSPLPSPIPPPTRAVQDSPMRATEESPKRTGKPSLSAINLVSKESQSAASLTLQGNAVSRTQDSYALLPCMDCGEEGNAHRWNCNIGNLNITSNLSALDHRELADATERFDPGPWTRHYDQFPEPEPENSETRITGIAEFIRNEESYKMDKELHGLPDATMVMLWAFKRSKVVQIVSVQDW